MKLPLRKLNFLTLLLFISAVVSAHDGYELNSDWHCQNIKKVAVSGEQLSQPSYVINGWEKATVPGTVLTTMLKNGQVPDPFFGMNNKKIPDIYFTGRDYYTYWFVKDFKENPASGASQVYLNFRGVNYSCDIFLNGKKVNQERHYGMNLRQSYNITSLLAKDGNNRLAVVVYPPDPVGNPNGGQGGDVKGFKGFDPKLALDAMKASSMRDDYGMKYMKEKGYIPADKEKESVSKALEYALSDWAIAQMAKKMGDNASYEYYAKRAKYYTKYFDPETQFMRPKMDDGSFRKPFNPFYSLHEWGDYTEGNAWQYTWLAPQDPEGLIHLFGGEQPFVKKLDSLFVVSGYMGDHASPDISGLIGQYAQGNEPSHHITYLYAFAGQQWKTAEKIHQILTTEYHDKPAGLSGNEDCGQMSAWYILSSLGFYQVNPASGCYVFGSPSFDQAAIALADGKKFVVKTIRTGTQNTYIQSAKLDGKEYPYSYITYKEIMKGGVLEFVMGDSPNKSFGAKMQDRPQSKVY